MIQHYLKLLLTVNYYLDVARQAGQVVLALVEAADDGVAVLQCHHCHRHNVVKMS